MNITITVQANPHTVHIHIPQADMSEEVLNVVAYRVPNRICAFSKTPEILQQELPEYWPIDGPELHFVYPFDVKRFEPEFASAFIRYYTLRAHAKIRPSLFSFWRWIDRLDYRIWIARYTQVPSEEQIRFERALREYLNIRSLSIESL
jgi:hypothetical protein